MYKATLFEQYIENVKYINYSARICYLSRSISSNLSLLIIRYIILLTL